MDNSKDQVSQKVVDLSTITEVGPEPSLQSEEPPIAIAKEETYLQAVQKHPRAFLWCMYIVWVMLSSNYINTAGNSVLGIPRFRKDFGRPYEDDFVLPAKWQSAYFGAPSAA